ncbi:DUF2064 domain-containing protein [Arcicella sp. LKC2W]|uniref:TIGR04282 family arsenosugar biosynthesis glycosyltransferase n=1 Tax=Arcicella sp. LKC2W TaxID=2984198 RepID=UPI002B21D895|nr:DUF2064 domain-containing protein [Arcicella sp. LKC2W]MEA5461408.1 DUF2064 domain-containing protein [Arcicella sp. LKC2W]
MSHQHALIIFIDNSQKRENSNLAQEIGIEKTLAIQKVLSQVTQSITDQLLHTKIIFYSDYIDQNDNWSNTEYEKQLQQGKNMGERMKNAFEYVFNLETQPIKQACIIWGDVTELTLWHLTKSYYALNTHDCVLGPTNSGTYYLLGMKSVIEEVFQNKTWGNPNIIRSTCDGMHELRKSYYLLPYLSDINSIEHFTPQFSKLLIDIGIMSDTELINIKDQNSKQ